MQQQSPFIGFHCFTITNCKDTLSVTADLAAQVQPFVLQLTVLRLWWYTGSQ